MHSPKSHTLALTISGFVAPFQALDVVASCCWCIAHVIRWESTLPKL